MSSGTQQRIGRAQVVTLHRALLGSLLVMVLVVAILLYKRIVPLIPDLATNPVFAWTFAIVPLVPMLLGWLTMRTKVPGRPSSLPAERYWAETGAGPLVLVSWVLWEGAAVLGCVGVLTSGALPPAITGLLAFALLLVHSPTFVEERSV